MGIPLPRRGLAALASGAAAALALAAGLLVAPTAANAAVSGRNLPANGQIRFFMGQDSTTLAEYKSQVLDTDATAPRPGGVTLYTNIVFPDALAGVYTGVDYGSGLVDFNATLGQYPGAALAVGLYLSDTKTGCYNQPLRAIAGTGDADVTSLTPQYRAKVDELVTWFKNTGREVFLRIGYEFDGPWNCYSADYYKQAYRYIKGRIDALGATKVATVWQSAAWPLNEHPDHPEWNYVITAADHYDVWYPGDDVVDWVGMSAFYGSTYAAYQWSCKGVDTSPRVVQDRVLAFARAHGKPVMIAESSPQGFTTGAKTASCILNKAPAPVSADTIWNTWYADYFGYIAANADVIRAVAYINTNWDSQTMWQCTGSAGTAGCANGYWGDSRIQADATIKSRFLSELRNARWVNGTGVGTTSPAPSSSPNPSPSASPSRSASPSPSPSASPSPSPTGSGGTGGNPYGILQAESASTLSNSTIVTDASANGGAKVRGNANNASLTWSNLNLGSPAPTQLKFHYSSNRPTNSAFTIEVHSGSPTGPVIASPGVLGTGSWTTYADLTYNLSNAPTGVNSISVVFKSNDGNPVADLDYVTFVGTGGSATTSPSPVPSPSASTANPTPSPTGTGGGGGTGQRLLLAGQSTSGSYSDMDSVVDTPGGGSVYYEVKSGTWVNTNHRDYATQLAQRGQAIQIGVSWKDNPPGFTGGDENTKAARSRAVTQELANGQYASQFTTLINFIRQYPAATFYLRIDYEVSSFYHCTDSSCASYKNAFSRIRNTIASQVTAGNVRYVYHPVRGEFEALYPGDAAVDWVGVSIFAHELCLPIYDNGYLYNGTPPQNYDTSTSQCRNAYLAKDANGNDTAVWTSFNHDGNVLKMMKFAKEHAKPMIVSESGMMNFTADGSDTRGLEPVAGNLWMQRLFSLLSYNGPIPNLSGTYDLSNVIQAVTYINLDFRYGWDGVNDGTFDFPANSTWFADGRLSQYTTARTTFCAGLTTANFRSRC
ncbi:carbohydrate-binding protein [Catellatospora sp. KI3]|uniref:carbohydrate-binding protein n=1 Tax=Catellatospora sp. KI3 TaxID=3041620 RepID=UPI002482EA50|nr:carbohydrate-binding protein [Catellatospora sp. KI3]MDI1462047.1 carbohydrate-binding protein [Catellatospora sp. KI3]